MANRYSQATETLDRLAVQTQGIIEAAAVLRELGSLESSRDGLLASITEAQRQLEEANGSIEAARETALTIVQEANDQADAVRAEAQQIREDAKVERDRMKAEVAAQLKAEREGVMATIAGWLAVHEQRVQAGDKELAELQAEADLFRKQVEEEKGKLETLRIESDKLKEQARALLSPPSEA